MNKKIKIFISLLMILVLGVIGFAVFKNPKMPVVLDTKNGTYLINESQVTLKDSYNEREIVPGSASKEITRYFGNEIEGDFNKDGFLDKAFLLTTDGQGSGTFYYVAVLLGKSVKAIGTKAVFIGDRIAPQTIDFRDDMIIVNFAERKSGESFDVKPSVGVSKFFKVLDNNLVEINKE